MSQHAGAIGAHDVEEPDQRQRIAGDLRRQTMVFEVARQVDADEDHLKTAHKIARHQQLETAVAERFLQGLPDALLSPGRRATREAGFAQPARQRHHHQHRQGQCRQGLLPPQALNQKAFHRHHQKLAKRASGRRNAHGPRAPLGGHIATDHPINHRIGGTGLRHAN